MAKNPSPRTTAARGLRLLGVSALLVGAAILFLQANIARDAPSSPLRPAEEDGGGGGRKLKAARRKKRDARNRNGNAVVVVAPTESSDPSGGPSNGGIRRAAADADVGRPVMRTFYEPDDNGDATTDAELALLAAWNESWTEAGWDTAVLTLRDAELHPKFDEYESRLRSSPLSEYQRMCYRRWIAMAATVGGGYMSDFDTFPLKSATSGGFGPFPPRKFTVHDAGAVPCLLSGSKSEWERLTERLMTSSASHVGDRRWSDMHALQDLRRSDPNAMVTVGGVMGAQDLFELAPMRRASCDQTRGYKAIHFSHYSIDLGMQYGAIEGAEGRKGGLEVRLNQRGEIAKRWIEDLRRVCQ